MVQADYGYEKVVSDGVTTLRIKRNRSAFVALVWTFAIIMSVVIMLVSTQINNGRGGPPPMAFLGACGVLFGIAILCSVGGGHTTVTLRGDMLSLDSGDYAKRDIGKVRVHEPGTGGFTYDNDLEYASEMAMRNAIASQNHWVTFDYGSKPVTLARKLTGAQADRVGSELADWLAA